MRTTVLNWVCGLYELNRSFIFDRNEQTRIRRVWGLWQKFMRMRAKEKLEHTKQRYEKELYVP